MSAIIATREKPRFSITSRLMVVGLVAASALSTAHAAGSEDYYFRTPTSGLLKIVGGGTDPGPDPGGPRQQLVLLPPVDVALRLYDSVPASVKALAQDAVGNVSYSVSPALPSGLSLNADGSLTGSASSVSPETVYTITGVDAGGGSLGTASTSFKIAVDARVPVEIAGVSSFDFEKDGGSQSFRLSPGQDVAIHGSASWTVTPSLPAWLSLSYEGNDVVVSGSPTALDPVGFNANFTLSDSHDTSPQHTVSIKVLPAAGAAIALPESLPGGMTYLAPYYTDLAVNTQFTKVNESDVQWTLLLDQPGDAMIPGITFADGTLQGQPLTLGTFTFGVKAEAPGGITDTKRYIVFVQAEETTRVSSTYNNSCMRLVNGTVKCWGENANGLLGNNTGVASSSTPVVATALSGGWLDLAGGYSGHYCALKSDRTVWCWGLGGSGQLGNGANATSRIPVQVSNLTDVQSIVSGYRHTCALKTNGSLWCWGEGYGLGDGDGTWNNRNVPVSVQGMSSGVISIAGGNGYSCASKNDGTVWCWGANDNGRLGDGTTAHSEPPVRVANLTDVIAMAGGYDHTCAVKSDRTVWCWGSDQLGQLGIGPVSGDVLTPRQVVGLNNTFILTNGDHHNCSINMDRTVDCWGSNSHGQLGDGTYNNRDVPVRVQGISDVTSLSSIGYKHTCATKTDGSAWCWGDNSKGQLGNGSPTSTKSTVPVRVSGT